jgi:hypothetical protein
MAMVSAIQEAQRDNLRSFDSYMLKVVEVSYLHILLSSFHLTEDKFSVYLTVVVLFLILV